MCGQAGIIFGTKARQQKEIDYLKQIFEYLLLKSEERGPYATGAATLKRTGEHSIFKRPLKASEFIKQNGFAKTMGGIDGCTTWLAGHTRWPTRGSHLDNRNNQPLLVGRRLLGTHNGHVENADALFRRFDLPRFAEVDSEVIFRMACTTLAGGRIDEAALVDRLALFRGKISAVMASKLDPERVVVIKGNKPLELRCHEGLSIVVYASDPDYLDSALLPGHGWREIPIEPMSLVTFHCDNLLHFGSRRFRLARVSETAGFQRFTGRDREEESRATCPRRRK